MAPRVEREAIAVVLDVSASSSHSDANKVSDIAKAKQCLSWIIKRKILSESKDELGIILLGSEETNNALAEDDFAERYENINVLSEHLSMATWDMLRQVDKVCSTCVEKADWLDAIIVAMDFLKNAMEGKVFSESKIVVLSNFSSEVKSDDQVNVVINNINKMGINLVAIGLDIVGENSETPTEKLLARIITDTKGVICGFDEALTQLRFFSNSTKNPMPFNVCLTVSSILKIPVAGFKMIDGTVNKRWKKKSQDRRPILSERGYFNQDKTLEQDDIIAGFTYGHTIVPFSDVEKKTMSYHSGDKCLSVLECVPQSKLPQYIFTGDTVYYFIPQNDQSPSAVAFAALVKALKELDMAMIVRKVYRAGSAPMLGAMFPKIEDDCCILLFIEMPYSNDVKDVEFPQLCKVKNTEEQLNCVDKLITAMDLTNPDFFDDDEEPYLPKTLINPFTQHMDHCIAFKALNKNESLPSEPEKIIQDLLKPLPIIAENANEVLEEMKSLFPLEVKASATKNKQAAVMFDPDRKVANIDVNGIKTEVDSDTSMMDLMKSSVLHISTVDPVSDFKIILKSGTPFDKACEQMQSVIMKLIISRGDGIEKPLAALAYLRSKYLEENPENYNSWLGSLKDVIVERDDMAVWESIVQENLGLITKSENDKSNIGADEAKIFYEIKKQEQDVNKTDDAMDADELLDMM